MSHSTQTAVLKAIEAQLDEAGLILVQDAQWANTGTLYATDGLDPIGETLRYNFQNDYIQFSPPGSQIPYAAWWQNGSGSADRVGHSLPDLVDRVTRLLTGAPVPA